MSRPRNNTFARTDFHKRMLNQAERQRRLEDTKKNLQPDTIRVLRFDAYGERIEEATR
jgi:hypothetical protein